MPDQQMPEDDPVRTRHQVKKILLDFLGIGVLCKAQPPGESPHVRIDNNPLRDLVGIAEHHVGSLAPDSWQLYKRGQIGRHCSAVARRKFRATTP
jgi:hypothetical protein